MWLVHNKQKIKKSKLCRVLLPRHSAKRPFFYFLKNGFDKCYYLDTQQSLKLCRVPDVGHSAMSKTLLSAQRKALDKVQTLPSALRLALGKKPIPTSSFPSRLLYDRPVYFILPSGAWHTAKLCRVSVKWHSAKPASPSDETLCALCRELHSAKLLPSVFWALPSVCGTQAK